MLKELGKFVIHLNIIEDFLGGEGIKYLRLVSAVESPTFPPHTLAPKDGNTPQAQRQKDMDAFNAPDSEYFIYILSTRAGGRYRNHHDLVRTYYFHRRCWYQLVVGRCRHYQRKDITEISSINLRSPSVSRMSISTRSKICKCVHHVTLKLI